MRWRRCAAVVVSIVAVVAWAATLGGCGGDETNDAPTGEIVASVGSTAITRSDFEEGLKMRLAEATSSSPGAVSYDPPGYSACIAGKREHAEAKQGPQAAEPQLKRECGREHRQLRDQAMRTLVRTEWVRDAAQRRGLKTTEEATRRAEQDIKAEFPDEQAYRRYLAASGETEQELHARARMDALNSALEEALATETPTASDQELRRYYAQHRRDFYVRQRRGVRVLTAKTRADAAAGRAAIEAGAPWGDVVRRHSVAALRPLGGQVVPMERGKQDASIDRAVFRTDVGAIVGPVKTPAGWGVFSVEYIRPPFQKPFEDVRSEIADELRVEAGQDVVEGFIERYRNKTTCAAGYRIPDCRNANQ